MRFPARQVEQRFEFGAAEVGGTGDRAAKAARGPVDLQGRLASRSRPEVNTRMTAGASSLETIRRIAASEGIPLDCVDALALSPSRVARLLDVSKSTIENELAAGALATTWVRGSRRVAVLDVVEYMHSNRSFGPRTSRRGSPSELDSFLERFSDE